MKVTTRSAIECGIDCKRRRWFNFLYKGKGIVPAGDYVELATGGAIHGAIEVPMTGGRLEKGLVVADKEFGNIGNYVGLSNEQADYVYLEQKALIEALARAWYLREYPRLVERYNILAVEKEYEVELTKDILLLCKPDALLEDKEDGTLYTYSIKTMKQWYERSEKSYKVGLQGFTEILATTIATGKRVAATKFCFLVKGDRRKQVIQTMEDGMMRELEVKVTSNPFIYGYQKYEDGKFLYAHSDKTVKPQNYSGFGKLGKGWEKFKVWEKSWGVKKWIEVLAAGKVQPELGDIVKQHVLTPTEVFRGREQLKDAFVQIKYQEIGIFQGQDAVENGENISKWFPMNRDSCYFPSACPYLRICPNGGDDFEPKVADAPIGSGEFEVRKPHYEGERKRQDANKD